MTIMIIGGSASGKSKIAEELLCSLSPGKQRYYVATMKTGKDEENLRRVTKHREQRKEKGFITVECQQDIEQFIKETGSGKNVLLECVSNLAANEMFSESGFLSAEETARKVIKGMKALAENAENLVIVSNNVFESGLEYDELTCSYMKALGLINREMTEVSDEVYEAVVGIKLKIK